MKGHLPFRSVEEWKSALMTLPESNFFELLRSVFGNIKTPFSKQRLLDDLFILLSRNEIRNTIAAYIDEQDHKIMAAVALLNEPAPADMESFFTGEFNRAELHALIINLEERLIVYRFREDEILRLSLNPVLETVLAPFAADTGPLFPCHADEKPVLLDNRKASAWIPDGRLMAALFVFLQGEEELYRTENVIRKKVLDDGKKYFPSLDLDLAIRALLRLGLFRRDVSVFSGHDGEYQSEERNIVSCADKIADYIDLSSMERQAYWTAGVYLCQNEAEQDAHNGTAPDFGGAPRFSRNRQRVLASFIHRFWQLLDPAKSYPENTLRRFINLIERDNAGTGKAWGSTLLDRVREPPLPFEPFIAAMEMTGLLIKTGTGWKPGSVQNEPAEKGASPKKPVIVMDSASSFVLYPEISFADAMALSTFCSIKENDGTAIVFELTRESVVRGFDQGMKASDMLELLDRLSLKRLDTNLAWTLKEWESRYAGVSLNQGIILTLAEDRRYLAEARPVSSLIERELAPGVYLLSSSDRAEAARALKKAGVDIIAQPPVGAASGKFTYSKSFSTFPYLGSDKDEIALFQGKGKEKASRSASASQKE